MPANLPASYPVVQTSPRLASVVPPRLAALQRWTAWVVIPPKKEGGKPGKKPTSLTNDGSTWLSLPDALTAASRIKQGGIGFQMLGVSTIVGIDLDNCRTESGSLSKLAQDILAAAPNTYAEVTPSGTGLRLFLSLPDGAPPPPEFLNREQGVECYVGRSARFLTVTGAVLDGRAGLLSDMTPALARLLVGLAGAGSETTEPEIQLPLPTSPRVDDWKAVFDARRGKPDKNLMVFLEQGDIPGARSEKTFAVATFLLSRLYSPEEVYTVLHSAPGSWEAALDKRDQDPARARSLLWADIGRAQKIVKAELTATEGQADVWAACGLHVEVIQKRLTVIQSNQNAFRVLSQHESWRNRVALDITSGVLLLDGTPLDDARFFDLQEKVTRFCKWTPNSSRQWWVDVLRAVAEKNPINPREAWLRSLQWDGTTRLDTWLNDHVAGEKNSLNAKLGRKWLISLVARWIKPGCQVDTVLILAGSEGTRKTSFFRVMAGGADRVVALNGFERDDKFAAARAWIVEMPEAHLLRRGENARLKAFVTDTVDTYRPPYAALPVTAQRGFVIVSTANRPDELFQASQDGLRRYWPVVVRDSKIDLFWLEKYREQLLAEAVVAYDLEEQWWFDEAPEELKDRVEASVESSMVDEALTKIVVTRVGKGGMTLTEIVSEITAMVGYRPHERAVAGILPRHGIMRKRTATERFWMHKSWEAKEGNNVVPFKKEEVGS